MDKLPPCPQCGSAFTYEDGTLLICPECAYEWVEGEEIETGPVVKDANGNPLHDGDDVTIAKDIKVKGSSSPIKVGTKVKNIRLIDPVNGHDIDAKVPGFGEMLLKSIFVKKCN